MKTTIDIPVPLYMAARIRAVEKNLGETSPPTLTRLPTFGKHRRLLPEFERMLNQDGLSTGTDSIALISGDRTARDDALL